ncbi:MAG: RNA-binding cell elongation regulator Jag/EloR [Pseudoflavonifractor sp.]
MEKYIECTGRNEEFAIEAALSKLGLDRDEVSVEILERPKSGFLGIGGSPAKVKVTYQVPDEPAPAPKAEAPKAEPRKPAAPKQETPRHAEPAPAIHHVNVTPSPVAPDDEKAAQITDFLSGLLTHMGAQAQPSIQQGAENTYEVELLGEHLGALIGRRGETLDAIQQITNYAVNHGETRRVRVHVDAEHYRSKREESLEHLAEKVAAKVVKYRRNTTLEPMNAYERHVIHTALQEYPDITTYSTGTEPNRRTVVAYSAGEHRA